MYRRVGKALAEPDLPPCQVPIAASQWHEFKERVEWVGGVRYDGSCSTCSGCYFIIHKHYIISIYNLEKDGHRSAEVSLMKHTDLFFLIY